MQNHLVSVQPEFKSALLNGVAEFKVSVAQFVDDYNEKYASINKIITISFEQCEFYQLKQVLTCKQSRFDFEHKSNVFITPRCCLYSESGL